MVEHITQEFLSQIKLPDKDGKNLNYLIVIPKIVHGKNSTYMIPYGICMVSAALKASGRNVYTLNLNYKDNINAEIENAIKENNIDVVATGGLSAHYSAIKEITDAAKRINPDIITMVGGGMVTAEPEVALEALETADYCMIGEGEITINELAYAIEHGQPAHEIEGVIVKNHNYESENWKARPEISDLNMLPFPDYDGFEYFKLMNDNLSLMHRIPPKTALIAGGRSCPFNCTFCFHSAGKKYRKRTVENVLEEIDWILGKYDIEYIMFLDELFIMDENYLNTLTSEIKKRGLKYWVEARVDMINEKIVRQLKDSGCDKLFFGVESADDSVLKSMRKNIKAKDIEHAFELAKEVGLETEGNLIFGDVAETKETVSNTLAWWKAHPDYDLRCIQILTFPGSQIYKNACQRGIITDRVKYLREGDMLLNLTQMSDEEYSDIMNHIELYQILNAASADIDFHNIGKYASKISKKLDELALSNTKTAIWPATPENIKMLNYLSPKFINNKNTIFTNINPLASGEGGIFVLADERQHQINLQSPEETFKNNDIDAVLYAFGNRHSKEIKRQIKNETAKLSHNLEKNIDFIELTNLAK